MAPNLKHTQPNFKRDERPEYDWGISRTEFWRGEKVPVSRLIRLQNVHLGTTFNLPANVALSGDAVVFNRSAASVTPVLTVAGAATGTFAATPAARASRLVINEVGNIPNAARAVTFTGVPAAPAAGVDSKTGIHVAFWVTEYPPTADTTARS